MSKSTGADFQAKLDRSLGNLVGNLPKGEMARWRNLLAVEETLPQPAVVTKLKGASVGTLPSVPEQSGSQSAGSSHDRPDRANKKRKYTDNSFSGYEVFGEDDETDDDGMKKKRKRVI
jgi:Rox3 mediator complex subunit